MSAFGPPDPFRVLSALRSATARLARAARPDHGTINERSLRSYGAVMTHAFLHAAVAPSRRIPGGSTDELTERAAALSGALGLPTVPFLAGAESHRFVELDATGSHTRSLVVTRSGALELLWALEQLPTADGAWAVRAIDACTQLARFAGVVRGDDYGRLLASSWWRRRVHSRVDWMLGVTVTNVESTGGRGWRDILVLGEQPSRASGHTHGRMSPAGYGTKALRGTARSREPATIVRVMLDEWLRTNGYLRPTSAVEATVAAAIVAAY